MHVLAAAAFRVGGSLKGQPVGWISVAPREQYEALERSRVFRRIDREPVWSVVTVHPGRKVRDAQAYMGTVSLFRRAGFVEVARTVHGRPVMRYYLSTGPQVRQTEHG